MKHVTQNQTLWIQFCRECWTRGQAIFSSLRVSLQWPMQYVESVCVGDLPRKMNILNFLDWIPQLISLLKLFFFCFLFPLHFSDSLIHLSPSPPFNLLPTLHHICQPRMSSFLPVRSAMAVFNEESPAGRSKALLLRWKQPGAWLQTGGQWGRPTGSQSWTLQYPAKDG